MKVILNDHDTVSSELIMYLAAYFGLALGKCHCNCLTREPIKLELKLIGPEKWKRNNVSIVHE